jgi:predicted SnoaL-like aldol condensation-catalyzing enzyme
MTNKEIAEIFLELCATGNSRDAFKLYVHEQFIHHNAYFKGDRDSLMIAMEENAKSHPNKIFAIQRALEDGDMVAVHSRVVLENDNMELAVMHIFKFVQHKIVELWDFGQAVPTDMVNENGMF